MAALDVVRPRPERLRLLEVVHVLGEADLVHAALPRTLDERFHGAHGVVDPATLVAQMHVVVDDHSSDATRARSSAVVTLRSSGSPGTTFTRPPAASTRPAQSVAW